MATATEPVRHPKGPTEPALGPSASRFFRDFLDSSVGAKLTVGLTGALLVLFTIAHLVGNLKLLQGPTALNGYAYFLKHDIGLLLWAARGGLLLVLALHVVLAVRLQLRARAARPVRYAHRGSVQATTASRTMLYGGLVVGLYLLFHIAHFTLGWVKPAVGMSRSTGQIVEVNYLDLTYPMPSGLVVHDVYTMVISGFTNPLIVVVYLLAQVALFFHLRHGIPSTFQTFGVKGARWAGPIDVFGLLVALAVVLGNCGLVLAVWYGFVKPIGA